MMTKRLLDHGILNTGEPRHYNSWETPSIPKLNYGDSQPGISQELYRRQKAFAPPVRQLRTSINQIIYAIRTTKRTHG